MNILFYFVNQINPLKGGTERSTDLVAHELMNRGHKVYYMSYTRVEGDYDAECFFLSEEGVTPANIDYVTTFCRRYAIDVIINEAGNTNEVRLFSKEHIPAVKIITVLHFCPSQSLRYFYRSLRSPLSYNSTKAMLVQCCRWLKAPYNRRKLNRIISNNYRYMYENSDKIVVLSPSYIKELVGMAGIKETTRIVSINNPNTFKNSELRVQKEKVVLSIGRLQYAPKRIDLLLEIWKDVFPGHSDWKLEICGDGDYKEQLEYYVKKHCIIGVKFCGKVHPRSYYERASIMCMTSLNEGMPMVIAEASQCHCVPMVYDTYSAAKDMIDDGKTGFIIPPFNKKEYARKLSLLMDNEDLRQQMGNAAKASTERFEIEGIIDQWEELIKG